MGNRRCGIYSSVWQACFSQLGGSTINPELAFKHWTSCTTCNQDLLRLKTFLETRASFKVLQRTIVPLLISNISNPYYMENNISMDLFIFWKYCLSVQEEVMDEVEDEEKGPVWEAAPATSKAPAVAAWHASAKAGAPSSSSAPWSSSTPLPPPLLANVWVCFFPKWCLELGERLLPLYEGEVFKQWIWGVYTVLVSLELLLSGEWIHIISPKLF